MVGEVFKDLSAHMIKGLMVHSQMADYYRMLALPEYADCHEERYMEESCGWRKLCKYYVDHYEKLIEEKPIDDPKVIPEDWFKATRRDVDTTTKRRAVQSGMEKWMNWEKDTLTLYQGSYKTLMDEGHVAAALFLKKYIKDTDKELAKAMEWYLHKKDVDYDITYIVNEQ